MGKQRDTFALPPKSRTGSVQSAFVRLRGIAHNVLCLASPANPKQREYRAILEVSATNYTLTSEEEQERIVAGYHAFLKALTFPIQILVRSQQLDLKPYVQSVLESSTTMHNGTWRALALAHAQYVHELAARRTLLEHRFYLIIPADQGSDTKPHTLAGLFPFGNTGARNKAESLEKAQQQLDLRAEVIAQQLASLGLQCRRMAGYELASLYYSCLTPDRALRSPLLPQAFAGTGQPTRVKQKTSNASPVSPPDTVSPPHVTEQPPLADLLAPAKIEVTRDAICLEGEYARALVVTGFPAGSLPWLAGSPALAR